jgi:two-component system, OmpR family, sensor histidine kinase KdpD
MAGRGRIIEDQLKVLVVDRDVGVPAEDVGRVCDQFYQGAEWDSANGLGLAICKGFIEAHGGRIRVANNPIGGIIARFVILLHTAVDGDFSKRG